MIQFSKTGIAQTKNRKLKKFQVLEILELCKEMAIPTQVIADLYNVSYSTVYFIACGYRWKNLTKISVQLGQSSKVHGAARLSPKKIRSIRKKWDKGTSQNALAKTYKISQPVIFDIVHRRTYRGV